MLGLTATKTSSVGRGVETIQRISFWMLLAFAASIPVEDAVQFGIGRLSKVIGLVAFATWALLVFLRGRLRPLTPVHLVATGFVTWCIATYFWTLDTSATITKAATLVQMVAVVWLVVDQAHSRYDLIRLMRAFVVGSFVGALVTTLHASHGIQPGVRRFSTVNTDTNNTGALLAVALMLALYLLIADSKSRWKWVYRAFLPIAGVNIILTGSRGALISLAFGLATVLVTTKSLRAGRLLALVAAGSIALVLAAVLVPQGTLDRLGTTKTEIQSGNLDKRLLYWRTAFRLWGEHPIQGIGLGSFRDANYQEGNHRAAVAHSAFMSVLVETGSVGWILFLLSVALAAAGGFTTERAELRRPWIAIWVSWALGAASLTWETRKITWFLMALGVVHISALREERRALAEAAEPLHLTLTSDADMPRQAEPVGAS
jgi:O-antigen ligase